MKRLLLTFLFLCYAGAVQAAGFDHGPWDGLLERHVIVLREGRATEVDYAGMAADRAQLKAYLDALSKVEPERFAAWPRDERLAFLINTYNAWTVELVLGGYPGIRSIKELGGWFSSPWKKRFIPLLGRTLSLDDIEHGMIRGGDEYREPRIHFAVNCASVGCPALRHEAYVGERLEAQLEDATRRFLSDRTRNRYDPATGRLEVSKIFDWYGDDFERGWGGHDSLDGFFARYAESLADTPLTRRELREGRARIGFLDYDWGLNGR